MGHQLTTLPESLGQLVAFALYMQRSCFGSNQLTTLTTLLEFLGHLEKQAKAMDRGRSRYSRSRSREEKQKGSSREENACADDKSKKAYKCGMCRRPFPEGVWQAGLGGGEGGEGNSQPPGPHLP